MVSQKVKTRIDAIFPLYKNGEGLRPLARQIGVHHTTLLEYMKGQYWALLEAQWNEKQAKLKEAEMAKEKDHIEAYGERYQADLEAMQKRLVDLSQAFVGIATQEIFIARAAMREIQRAIAQGGDPIEACNKIQRKGVAQTALDSAKLSKEARDQFAEAYGIRELLDNLEKILDNLKHNTTR